MIRKTNYNSDQKELRESDEEEYQTDQQYEQERFTDEYSEYFEDDENKDNDIPLITSEVDIFPNQINFKTVRDIVNESIDIVQDFLKVTSLSELSWHDWAFVEVYVRIENTEKAKLIFRKLASPKIKSPKSYSLKPIVYSNDFIKTAWSGYCKELDDIYVV